MTTPDFKPNKIVVEIDYLNETLGLNLNSLEIKKLLEKRRHNVQIKHNKLHVEFPAYRQDIIHSRDIAEELAISYGYNKFEAEVPRLATFGEQSKESETEDKIAGLLVGLNMQEIATLTLTNKKDQFKRMNLKDMPIVEIENPVSILHNVIRGWITPSLLAFFEKNKKARYSQKIFEIGTCIKVKGKKAEDIRRLAVAITHTDASYTEAKQILDYLLRYLGKSYEIKETEHTSFIEGRVGRVSVNGKDVAYIGEIHPSVLRNFGLEMPVSVFELNLSLL